MSHPVLIVDRDQRGVRLLDLLTSRWPAVDRRALRQLLDEERVAVNGEPSRGHRRVGDGDVITVGAEIAKLPRFERGQPAKQPASRQGGSQGDCDEPVPVVLAENEHVLVVDKPAGLPTIPDRAGKYRGALGVLREQYPDADLRAIHRLDAPTSGCLALAKGLEAARHFDLAFRERRVAKAYLALVDGVVRRAKTEVERPLGPDNRRPGRIRVVGERARGAREAHTTVESVEVFRRHSLVRARPHTGRSHQIRVHLESIGHPIVGDREYGRSRVLLLSEIKPGYKLRRGVIESPLLERMFLHAHELVLPMPGGDDALQVTAPLPAVLERTLDKLRRFAAARARSGEMS